MTDRIDPNKAIIIPPEQRQLHRGRPDQQSEPKGKGSTWDPHTSDTALDEWSLAVRMLRKAGKLLE